MLVNTYNNFGDINFSETDLPKENLDCRNEMTPIGMKQFCYEKHLQGL